MNPKRLADVGKKILVSILLSAAVLSVANIDMIWEEQVHSQNFEVVRHKVRQDLRARLRKATAPGVAHAATKSTQFERLRAMLAHDEFGDVNPFAGLSTLEPLTEMMNQGVVDYTRQAYRSPQYKDEIGYDLIDYEIEHPDKSKSKILAYMETPLGEEATGTAVPVVIVMRAHAGAVKQAVFRAGALVSQGDMTLAQAQALVSQKLSAGIPFISVSR